MKQSIYSKLILAFLLFQLASCQECGCFNPCKSETIEADISADLKQIIITRDNACSNCPGDNNYTYGYYYQNKNSTKTLTIIFKISIQIRQLNGQIFNQTETPTFTLKPGERPKNKMWV